LLAFGPNLAYRSWSVPVEGSARGELLKLALQLAATPDPNDRLGEEACLGEAWSELGLDPSDHLSPGLPVLR
jgi:hypothetical protein